MMHSTDNAMRRCSVTHGDLDLTCFVLFCMSYLVKIKLSTRKQVDIFSKMLDYSFNFNRSLLLMGYSCTKIELVTGHPKHSGVKSKMGHRLWPLTQTHTRPHTHAQIALYVDAVVFVPLCYHNPVRKLTSDGYM